MPRGANLDNGSVGWDHLDEPLKARIERGYRVSSGLWSLINLVIGESGVSGSGTVGRLLKWVGTKVAGDSLIADNGHDIRIEAEVDTGDPEGEWLVRMKNTGTAGGLQVWLNNAANARPALQVESASPTDVAVGLSNTGGGMALSVVGEVDNATALGYVAYVANDGADGGTLFVAPSAAPLLATLFVDGSIRLRYRRITANTTVLVTDHHIGVDTAAAGGAVTVTFPTLTADHVGMPFRVSDVGNNAGTNNIVVAGNFTDGTTSKTMNGNGNVMEIRVVASTGTTTYRLEAAAPGSF